MSSSATPLLLAAAAGAATYAALSTLLSSTTTTTPSTPSQNKNNNKNITPAELDNPYEKERALWEYLSMHYARPSEMLAHGVGPRDALEFPQRCAEECGRRAAGMAPRLRALDVGCAVGRSSFEMCRFFDEVVGMDYSQSFVDACERLRENGSERYMAQTEGDLLVEREARVNPSIDRSRATFFQGTACDLPEGLGQFHAVLAANLLCRLPRPHDFLRRLASLVVPGGFVVMPSPYSWLEEYTPREHWVGGYTDKETGRQVGTFDGIRAELEADFELVEERPMPFLIRETARKSQWTVSHLTVWRRRR